MRFPTRSNVGRLLAAACLAAAIPSSARAQAADEAPQATPAAPADATTSSASPSADEQARYQKLSAMLTGARLTGRFTIIGKADQAPFDEEYAIISAEKMEEKNYWLIKARIKYGDKDVTVPMPLPISWADDTPVISLTNFTIPLLGNFDCRVVLHDGKYAGTWRHGDVSGHLFGEIASAEPAEAAAPK